MTGWRTNAADCACCSRTEHLRTAFWDELAGALAGNFCRGARCILQCAQAVERSQLFFSPICLDSPTKSEFENVHGGHYSLEGGTMRTTDVMNGGKQELICDFGGVGMKQTLVVRNSTKT